jgi:hypothetical protein
MSEPNPLIEVAEFVREQAVSSRVAVVFDLDSTLFCVSPRTENILRRLAGEEGFKSRFAEAAEILRNVEVLPTDWGIKHVLERAVFKEKFSPDKLPSEAQMALFREVRAYWRKYFFSSHDLHKDKIYPSANEYVRHLHELGADILYLTGREEGAMREGSVRALKSFGFPLEDAKLIMKPSQVETDEGFKGHVLKDLAAKYDHIWFFENEPVIIALVRPLVPQVRIVFMNTVHAGRAENPTDLPTITGDFSSGLPRK